MVDNHQCLTRTCILPTAPQTRAKDSSKVLQHTRQTRWCYGPKTVALLLCGCKIWSLTVGQQHKLEVHPCCMPFCFNATYQFTLNLHSLIFSLTPLGCLCSITLTPNTWWEYHFWLTPTFSGTQLGRKTRGWSVCTQSALKVVWSRASWTNGHLRKTVQNSPETVATVQSWEVQRLDIKIWQRRLDMCM
jgi:hypothetical protein